MQPFNQLVLLDACVCGDFERFEDLVGDLFTPFRAFYRNLLPELKEATTVPPVHYEQNEDTVCFSADGINGGAAWNIPITKEE